MIQELIRIDVFWGGGGGEFELGLGGGWWVVLGWGIVGGRYVVISSG